MNLRRFDLWWERPGWTILNMWTGEDRARICRLDVIFDNYVSLSYSSISAGNLISTVCAFGGGERAEQAVSLISMAAEHGFATRQPGATVWYSVVQCGMVVVGWSHTTVRPLMSSPTSSVMVSVVWCNEERPTLHSYILYGLFCTVCAVTLPACYTESYVRSHPHLHHHHHHIKSHPGRPTAQSDLLVVAVEPSKR